MMQRNLSCKNFKDSQKNMITSVISQFFVILLFLMLGVLLYIFADNQGIQVEKSDELFPLIATGNYFPAIVGILFIIGLISSAYSCCRLSTDSFNNFLHSRYPRDKRQDGRRNRKDTQAGTYWYGCNYGYHDIRIQPIE